MNYVEFIQRLKEFEDEERKHLVIATSPVESFNNNQWLSRRLDEVFSPEKQNAIKNYFYFRNFFSYSANTLSQDQKDRLLANRDILIKGLAIIKLQREYLSVKPEESDNFLEMEANKDLTDLLNQYCAYLIIPEGQIEEMGREDNQALEKIFQSSK